MGICNFVHDAWLSVMQDVYLGTSAEVYKTGWRGEGEKEA